MLRKRREEVGRGGVCFVRGTKQHPTGENAGPAGGGPRIHSCGACCLIWPEEVQLVDNICSVLFRECLWSSGIQLLVADSHERSRELSPLISF